MTDTPRKAPLVANTDLTKFDGFEIAAVRAVDELADGSPVYEQVEEFIDGKPHGGCDFWTVYGHFDPTDYNAGVAHANVGLEALVDCHSQEAAENCKAFLMDLRGRQMNSAIHTARKQPAMHNLAVVIEGGIVQHIVSDTLGFGNCRAIVLDLNVEGFEEDDVYKLRYHSGLTADVLVNTPDIRPPNFNLADACIEFCPLQDGAQAENDAREQAQYDAVRGGDNGE